MTSDPTADDAAGCFFEERCDAFYTLKIQRPPKSKKII
jgi:hypothetical protein